MRRLVAFGSVLAALAVVDGCGGSSNHVPAPQSGTVTQPQGTMQARHPSPRTTGGNVIVNGGFETGSLSPWVTVGTGTGSAKVVSGIAHSGQYSAFMGTTSPPAVNGLHGISQAVTIPHYGVLSFWFIGGSNDQQQYADQEVDLTDSKGKLVFTCWKGLVTTSTWTFQSCYVGAYAGRQLYVTAGVNDNGYSQTYVYMYIDDIVLANGGPTPTPSPSPSATPTGTPTPTPAPTPPGNLVRNPGFETGKFAPWTVIGHNYGHATISTAQVHSGQYAALIGTTIPPAVNGFHGIAQTVVIPKNGHISLWVYGGSSDTKQYASQSAYLQDSQGQIVHECFNGLITSATWVEKKCYVAQFAGQTLNLVIGVNDNGYSQTNVYLYVDDVGLFGGKIPFPTPTPVATPTPAPTPTQTPLGASPIQHVVIILQENRTLNNIFHGYPGANTTSVGYNTNGHAVTLHETRLMVPYDPGHQYGNWLTEYNGGLMDGFDREGADAGNPPKDFAYAYAAQRDVQPYWDLAAEGVLADAFFADHRSQSYAGHLFPIAGASGPISAQEPDYYVSENPDSGTGCDSIGTGQAIDILTGIENKKYHTCFDFQTIADLITAGGKTWRYYVDSDSTSSIVDGYDSIRHIRNNPKQWANVVSPSTQVVADAQSGQLANVSWVIGPYAYSDHAGQKVPSSNGPSWVGDLMNAIGESPSWGTTAIIYTYDDWGGWYDAVPPPTTFNAFSPGFRLPFVVVAPYVHRGLIDHNVHYMGSILHYIETTFGLGSLGTSDSRSDDLRSMFNYTQHPLKYRHVKTKQSLPSLLAQPRAPAPRGFARD